MYDAVPGLVRIGNAFDCRNPEAIFEAETSVIVDLAYEESPAQLPRGLTYLRFPLLDGAGNDSKLIQLAIKSIAGSLDSGLSTMVCCSNGMSRSPILATAALAIVRGQSMNQVLETLVASHPRDLSPPLWDDVARACEHISTQLSR